ncbi:hypothetical protein FQJ88_21465 [Xanthomonas vasicola]|uniref:Uncharacterized protein n=1 Tax=Xanthomonas vasicola TaxID=56459 RepID=A0ABD7SFJ4_XANVA|nr:hypothetical protein NX81_010920 [Xanthomonas vasicola]TWQ27992.1 hypothetical protein FQJ97_10340 [Xanthomonas vasicola]TWQ33436.1 hypothetical protein FQJ96_21370 [Xanthomonas vasicola]TWQ50142.1 hypothetical protein FQJ94_21295 [Xanthomonas vasicola]TWQ52851.1 hypothetical protein FQJ93_21145 [Xanthomonas vasicola]
MSFWGTGLSIADLVEGGSAAEDRFLGRERSLCAQCVSGQPLRYGGGHKGGGHRRHDRRGAQAPLLQEEGLG